MALWAMDPTLAWADPTLGWGTDLDPDADFDYYEEEDVWIIETDEDTGRPRGRGRGRPGRRGGRPGRRRQTAHGRTRIPVDLVEADDHYEAKAFLPGISKDQIKLDHDGNALRIEVTYPPANEAYKGLTVHRVERPVGTLRRTIRVPDDTEVDKIDAKYDAGVLTVIIPKKEEAKRRRRSVAVGGAEQTSGQQADGSGQQAGEEKAGGQH